MVLLMEGDEEKRASEAHNSTRCSFATGKGASIAYMEGVNIGLKFQDTQK